MTVRLGILAHLEAVPGKGAELAAFLQAGRELAVAEQGTVTWYAFKISDTRFGIFDSFETDEDRQAHLNGEIPRALGQVAPDLLASPPEIRTVEIIAVKSPPHLVASACTAASAGSGLASRDKAASAAPSWSPRPASLCSAHSSNCQ